MIVILMSTYNGEKYLVQQIESLLSQKDVQIKILVRDDGSTDKTIEILEEYCKNGLLDYYCGENMRPALSFMDLVSKAPFADYYAFCDQDDVWLPNKLSKAIENMKEIKVPQLYISSTTLVDKELNLLSKEMNITKSTFGTAMLKNNATGCTMVFNKLLLDIVKDSKPKFLTMHDQWVYLSCFAVNGIIYTDTNSYILYRQHDSNVIGARKNTINNLKYKLKMLIRKEKTRQKIAVDILDNYGHFLDESKFILLSQMKYYHLSTRNKLELIRNGSFKQKKLIHNIFTNIAVFMNSL